jgi:hypothetical protein
MTLVIETLVLLSLVTATVGFAGKPVLVAVEPIL